MGSETTRTRRRAAPLVPSPWVGASTAAAPLAGYQNPLIAENVPDPCVLREGAEYFVYSTSGNALDAFPIRRSRDLVRWERAGHLFPRGRRPRWARSDFWAPEIHRLDDGYIAYYTARDRTHRLCIGVAWAETPVGPWTDSGGPLIRHDRVGMIDSHYFHDEDGSGRRFLYWKEDGNDLRPMETTPIYVQELSPDGRTLVGARRKVLENDLDWEGHLVEGPWLVRRGGYYYLFYSGNAFHNENYAVGVARATSPLGPFLKQRETVLRRDENWMGPGHGSVVRAHDGHDYFIYHAFQRGRVGGKHPRMLLMDRIHWENGWPRINDGSPSALPQAAPTSMF